MITSLTARSYRNHYNTYLCMLNVIISSNDVRFHILHLSNFTGTGLYAIMLRVRASLRNQPITVAVRMPLSRTGPNVP